MAWKPPVSLCPLLVSRGCPGCPLALHEPKPALPLDQETRPPSRVSIPRACPFRVSRDSSSSSSCLPFPIFPELVSSGNASPTLHPARGRERWTGASPFLRGSGSPVVAFMSVGPLFFKGSSPAAAGLDRAVVPALPPKPATDLDLGALLGAQDCRQCRPSPLLDGRHSG